jgi:hypothetical protein
MIYLPYSFKHNSPSRKTHLANAPREVDASPGVAQENTLRGTTVNNFTSPVNGNGCTTVGGAV